VSIIVVFGNAFLINKYPTMLRNLFHISVIAQVLIPLIMVHVPANGEVGMAILYADGQRVPLWEPTNTKSSGLADFCAKSRYFRVTLVSSRDSVKYRG
jgi:hypothetical protein